MYFLIKFLSEESSLLPHQASVLIIIFLLTLVFTAGSQVVRNQEGKRELNLVITAIFLWGFTFERTLIAAWYRYMIYPEYFHLLPAWRIARHISLLWIELTLYGLVYILLKDKIKEQIRNRVRGWLDG